METSKNVQTHCANNTDFSLAELTRMTNLGEHGVAYRVGSARIYPEQNCILISDTDIRHLRPKTFAVLNYLCEQRGRLVSKDELIKAVWQDVCVTDDSLVQCIVEIRRALGSTNGKYLRTVTRLGYLIHAETLASEFNSATDNIKVLVGPFRLLTQSDQQLFANGLGDSITMQLLQASELRLQVLASQDEATADFHLQGSLQTQESRTRATMQLIDLSTQQYVWAEVYEHQETDLFALQDQLSGTIAKDVITRLMNGGGKSGSS